MVQEHYTYQQPTPNRKCSTIGLGWRSRMNNSLTIVHHGRARLRRRPSTWLGRSVELRLTTSADLWWGDSWCLVVQSPLPSLPQWRGGELGENSSSRSTCGEVILSLWESAEWRTTTWRIGEENYWWCAMKWTRDVSVRPRRCACTHTHTRTYTRTGRSCQIVKISCYWVPTLLSFFSVGLCVS